MLKFNGYRYEDMANIRCGTWMQNYIGSDLIVELAVVLKGSSRLSPEFEIHIEFMKDSEVVKTDNHNKYQREHQQKYIGYSVKKILWGVIKLVSWPKPLRCITSKVLQLLLSKY